MKRIMKITGVLVLTFALVANLQYALLNYGISGNSLNTNILAQAGGAFADGTSGGGSSGGQLFGSSVETSCDARYDKSTTTTTTFTLSYKIENSVEFDVTGLVKTIINLTAQSTSGGVVRYTYSKSITTTVKAKQIRCPEWDGICFVVDCGE